MNPDFCLGCGQTPLREFYRLTALPLHSVIQLETRAQALAYPTGDIRLGFCDACGLIANTAFEPERQEYDGDYESTQSCSPTFDNFSRRLAADLISRFDLHNKQIIEIGCGMGEFLTLLCELGGNQGVGFDPAYRPGRIKSTANLRFISDFYSPAYAQLPVDFLVCKMTLEHIAPVAKFLEMVLTALAHNPRAVVFFQVPDTHRIFKEIAFWDIYYEHCSYFTPESLQYLFQFHDFRILDCWTDYGGQYVMIAAQLASSDEQKDASPPSDLGLLSAQMMIFQEKIQPRLAAWRSYFAALQAREHKVVLWGGGSKAVAFLTTLGISTEIEYCVDINPRKHGHFIAGTGQQIVSPALLQTYQPEVVIILNPIYQPEIQADLDRMGLHPELVLVTETHD